MYTWQRQCAAPGAVTAVSIAIPIKLSECTGLNGQYEKEHKHSSSGWSIAKLRFEPNNKCLRGFILPSMYPWHMGCRGEAVNTTFKHSSHYGTNICNPVQNKSVPGIRNQEATTCFMSVSATNCLEVKRF
jgi:hypothetical protein